MQLDVACIFFLMFLPSQIMYVFVELALSGPVEVFLLFFFS